MLPIYTVMSGKSLGTDREKKTSTYKVKDPLAFRNGQPDCDDNSRMFL
jgi:hypothetical protein